MTIVAQSQDQIRETLARVVVARWPDESLIFTTECGRDVLATARPSAHQPGSLGGIVAIPWRTDSGMVGATERRLVYHCHSVAMSSIRVASVAFAVIAMLVLPSGAYLPYDNIQSIDDVGQQIEGWVGSGAPVRIRIPDQVDFQMIVTLATGQHAANAA